MGLEDATDNSLIANAGGAFIVNDQVETLCVLRISIDGEGRLYALVVGVHLDDLGVKTFFDALFEDVLLLGVIVATAARDEEDAEGFGGLCLCGGGEEAHAEQQGG
jgi:hypothetical protein